MARGVAHGAWQNHLMFGAGAVPARARVHVRTYDNYNLIL